MIVPKTSLQVQSLNNKIQSFRSLPTLDTENVLINAHIKWALNLENEHLRANLSARYFQIINTSSNILLTFPNFYASPCVIHRAFFTLRLGSLTQLNKIFFSCVLY